MATTTGTLLALTASEPMNGDVVTIPRHAARRAAELFFRRLAVRTRTVTGGRLCGFGSDRPGADADAAAQLVGHRQFVARQEAGWNGIATAMPQRGRLPPLAGHYSHQRRRPA